MQTKLIAFLFVIVILVSCSTTKTIKLSPATSRSKELSFSGISGQYTVPSTADSQQSAYAKKLTLDSFMITKFDYNPKKHLLLLLKNGTLSETKYAGAVEAYKENPVHQRIIDSLDTEIIFLVGKRNNGSYVVIADQSNNKSFIDDSIYVFGELPQGHYIGLRRLDTLPQVKINNINALKNGELKTVSWNFILQPALGNIVEQASDLPHSSFMELFLVSVDHFIGQYKYKGKKYKVIVRNRIQARVDDNNKSIIVKFVAKKNNTDFQKHWNRVPEYKEGDTLFQLNNQQFVIETISPHLDYITIQRLRVPKV